MRLELLAFILVAPLLGCGPETPAVVGATAVASGATVPVFHRTAVDMLVSAATGRDCSAVHLDKGEAYCRPKEPPPERPPFCTRSLGVPDCWEDPTKLPDNPHEIADGPRALTPEQEKQRTSRWPGLW